jgi:hypothetical protein
MKAGMFGIGALLACLASGAMVACSHPASSQVVKDLPHLGPKSRSHIPRPQGGLVGGVDGIRPRSRHFLRIVSHRTCPMLSPDLPFGSHSPNQVRP